MQVKSADQIKKNYESGATVAAPRFTAGVNTAVWQAPSIQGQGLYVQQMQNPNILARRERGIGTVSDQQWRTDTVTKGAGVLQQRMIAASGKQVQNLQPYLDILASMTLPPRTGDAATNVANRVTPIAVAFQNRKNQM